MKKEMENIFRGLSEINIGFLIIFIGLWFLAYVSDRLTSTFLIAMILAFIIPCVFAFFGIRRLNREKIEIKTDITSRMLKYAELTLNILGYTLMGISAYVLSIYSPELSPNPYHFILHPYQYQSIILLITGSAIEIITALMYFYLLPRQIVTRHAAI